MKQLLILILSLGLFFTVYGGCGACGGGHNHSHSHDSAHSHEQAEKPAQSSCCLKEGEKKPSKSCCKKEKKRSCDACTSSCSSK